MRINRLFVDNYKTLVNFTVDFSQNSILIGPNGSGKSTVIQVIGILKEFILSGRRTEGPDAVFSAETITRWMKTNLQTFEMTISENGHIFIYKLQIEHKSPKCRVIEETVTCDNKKIFSAGLGKAYLINDANGKEVEILADWTLSAVGMVYEREDNKLLMCFKEAVKKIVICTPRPDCAKDSTGEESDAPSPFAENIVAMHRHYSQMHPELVADLISLMHDMNPAFSRVYLNPAGDEKILMVEYRSADAVLSYRFSELSDGEKMIFELYFLITIFLKRGYTLLLDEPDNYISLPEIQPWCQLIEEYVEEYGGQCLLISHHKEVIDYFAQNESLWFKRLQYSATRVEEAPVLAEPMTYTDYIIRGGWDAAG